MAAELVGGALLSGFISVMFERLAPGNVILKFFRGKKDLVKLLHKLKIKLMSANKLLSDAEEKQLTSSEVKKWLDELTHVIYRADFLMDKIETKALERKIKNESSTTNKIRNYTSTLTRKFERSVIDEGSQILEDLTLLLGETSHLGLKEGAQTRHLQRLHAPLVVKDSDAVGRDKDKEDIVKLLLSDDVSGQSLSVIPIVGMGGIGKTTLAQLVYEDSRVQKHFASKVWVTVSERFDVVQITKAIFQKVVTSQERGITELRELQRELNKALAGKMFLFVLDDVWNENYGQWDSLKSAFECGAHGSRIIVTTRSKDVALTMSKRVMHELKLVSDEDCWQIFEKHAFDDKAEATAELQEIGRRIVKRCKGLPLAVKSLSGLLRCTSKPEEWRKILNSDIWQLQFQKDLKKEVVPAVWLSYQFLPPYLKRCFAYLSVFPKDHRFDTKKIIWLWMAEGLLEAEKGKRAEEVGEEYLQALIGRSFFQYSSRDEEEPELIMHDIVHDLAMFISSEFSFEFNDSNDLSNLPTKACHLSISTQGSDDEVFKITKGLTSQTRSLCTILLLSRSYRHWPISNQRLTSQSLLHDLFLKAGGCLRVLSLSGLQQMIELPDSIGNMKYLRYLDLFGTSIKELPDSICILYNLQTLLLSNCGDLERLPTRLAALVNLRHLDIRETHLKEMPPQMCKLKSLETLSDFVLGENGGERIKELGELPLLGGSLLIKGLEYIVDVKDVLEANLKDKKFLSQLILVWRDESNITSSQHEQEREVLEALQPHTNLKQLTIIGYRGTIFPNWVGHESFCNMVVIELLCCRNVCLLPPLGQLSSLRRLEIRGLEGVASIGNEFCGSSSTTTNQPFTSLEYLRICYMASLEEWSFSSDRLGQEGGVFPSLIELRLRFCYKLIVGLPNCHLPSLKSIGISLCYKMEGVFVCQSCQEMDTNTFPSLKSLTIWGCKKLWENRTKWGLERLPSLMRLSLCGIGIEEEVESFPEEGLLPTTLVELSIRGFKKLKGLNGRAFQHLTSLQTLEIHGYRELECLPQEGLPLSLSFLRIDECPDVLNQRCQRGIGEDWPKIQHIPKILINFKEI